MKNTIKPESIDLSNLPEDVRLYIENLHYSNLELQAECKELEASVETLSKDKISAEKKLEKANDKIKEMKKYIDSIQAKIKKHKELIDRYNIERFVSKKDNYAIVKEKKENKGVPSTLDKEKKVPGKKQGSHNFATNDLKEGHFDKEVVINDLEDYKKEHPEYKLVMINEKEYIVYETVLKAIQRVKYILRIYKDKDGKIYSGKVPNKLSKCPAGYSTLADNACMKYGLGIPEYRYSEWLQSQGLEISSRVLNNWNEYTAEAIEPFYEYIETYLLASGILSINVDETTLKVLDNKNHINPKTGKPRQKSYIYTITSNVDGHPVSYYYFSADRGVDKLIKILRENNYQGAIVVDGYSGYSKVQKELDLDVQRCWVHIRREFCNVFKSLPKNKRFNAKSYKIVQLIDQIFDYEREFREKGLIGEERLKEREKPQYLNVCNKLKYELDNFHPVLDDNLEIAVKYYRNCKEQAWTFLANGDVEIHNNDAERSIKDVIKARKNYLHNNNYKGAKVSCVLMTVIALALRNDMDPRMYIHFLLEHHEDEDMGPLLPWNELFASYSKSHNE